MLQQGQGFPLAFLLRRWRARGLVEPAIDRAYGGWLRRAARLPRAQWPQQGPSFSIVMPVHDPNPAWLRAAIGSVLAQIYPHWTLRIVDDGSTRPEVASVLAQAAAGDPRIELQRFERAQGVTAATNAGLLAASGDYVAFLDHDDLLAEHALAAMAAAIAQNPRLDLLFSDEDQLRAGKLACPYFKPGYNPDLLLSQNAICHLAVYRRQFLLELDKLPAGYDGSQDHALALRAASALALGRVRHVPGVLYHWRQSATQLSAAARDACREAAGRAILDHLEVPGSLAWGSLPWPIVSLRPPRLPSLSVVGGRLAGAEEVVSAEAATGEVLLFLSPDLVARDGAWLDRMLAHLARPGVGAVGARLLGPGGRLVHAGYWLDGERVACSPEAAAEDPGYRGHFRLARSVAAVSLDCLAIRREVFVQAGGLEAQAGDFAGVDLCQRLARRGLRTVWEPQAELAYRTPPKLLREGAGWMRARWQAELRADPYANPNLALRGGRVGLAAPSVVSAPNR